LGIRVARARTVETHPAMIEMIAGFLNEEHAACAAGCCAAARRPAVLRDGGGARGSGDPPRSAD